MSDLREAAERLRKHLANKYDRNGPYWRAGHIAESWHFDKQQMNADIALLAAEHPADSDEPITEAWLRQIGFSEYKCPKQPCRNAFSIKDGALMFSPHYYQDFRGAWMFHRVVIQSPTTRGQLRLLLRALNIGKETT